MKKHLLKAYDYIIQHFTIVLIFWVPIYLCIAFCRWELYNPFRWIIDIPTYELEDRLGIFLCWLLVIAGTHAIIEQQTHQENEFTEEWLKDLKRLAALHKIWREAKGDFALTGEEWVEYSNLCQKCSLILPTRKP